jgi:hypothetical protein
MEMVKATQSHVCYRFPNFGNAKIILKFVVTRQLCMICLGDVDESIYLDSAQTNIHTHEAECPAVSTEPRTQLAREDIQICNWWYKAFISEYDFCRPRGRRYVVPVKRPVNTVAFLFDRHRELFEWLNIESTLSKHSSELPG